jgi:NADH-quinone oxidoreductase subunit M
LSEKFIVASVSFFLVSLIIVSLISSIQRDFKRLVAYSSVVHITPLPLLLLVRNSLSSRTFCILRVFHGISSPLMFFFVSLSYGYSSSRSLIFIKNSILVSPLLSTLLTLSFCVSVPTPPFPGFLAEVLLFIRVYSFSA